MSERVMVAARLVEVFLVGIGRHLAAEIIKQRHREPQIAVHEVVERLRRRTGTRPALRLDAVAAGQSSRPILPLPTEGGAATPSSPQTSAHSSGSSPAPPAASSSPAAAACSAGGGGSSSPPPGG